MEGNISYDSVCPGYKFNATNLTGLIPNTQAANGLLTFEIDTVPYNSSVIKLFKACNCTSWFQDTQDVMKHIKFTIC